MWNIAKGKDIRAIGERKRMAKDARLNTKLRDIPYDDQHLIVHTPLPKLGRSLTVEEVKARLLARKKED